jgi:hypothetical protein
MGASGAEAATTQGSPGRPPARPRPGRAVGRSVAIPAPYTRSVPGRTRAALAPSLLYSRSRPTQRADAGGGSRDDVVHGHGNRHRRPRGGPPGRAGDPGGGPGAGAPAHAPASAMGPKFDRPSASSLGSREAAVGEGSGGRPGLSPDFFRRGASASSRRCVRARPCAGASGVVRRRWGAPRPRGTEGMWKGVPLAAADAPRAAATPGAWRRVGPASRQRPARRRPRRSMRGRPRVGARISPRRALFASPSARGRYPPARPSRTSDTPCTGGWG